MKKPKIITLTNGQLIQVLGSYKEALTYIMDCYIDNKDYLTDDSVLYIKYKDGSEYILTASCEEGKFKKTGIATMIEDNETCYVVYGPYEIIKMDDTVEDSESCFKVEAV